MSNTERCEGALSGRERVLDEEGAEAEAEGRLSGSTMGKELGIILLSVSSNLGLLRAYDSSARCV